MVLLNRWPGGGRWRPISGQTSSLFQCRDLSVDPCDFIDEAVLVLAEFTKRDRKSVTAGTVPWAESGQLALQGAFALAKFRQTLTTRCDALAGTAQVQACRLGSLDSAGLFVQGHALTQQAVFVRPAALG
ncbi:hypothetical protein [Nonomuraea sp. NPDC052265]|uniref:hypothetical protein n=1 Tax=Nonomuraea sp. NPDC052265 TaxID=3364374 RepID=UPI0037C7EB38